MHEIRPLHEYAQIAAIYFLLSITANRHLLLTCEIEYTCGHECYLADSKIGILVPTVCCMHLFTEWGNASWEKVVLAETNGGCLWQRLKR